VNQIHEFVEKYLSKFLHECQIRNPFIAEGQKVSIPPKSEEVEELILYLQHNHVDPIIIGTIAVIKHLKITDEDIHARLFRPTHALELFITKDPPKPPEGWLIVNESNVLSWLSPSGGCVHFLEGKTLTEPTCPYKIEKDLESELMGCPVANVRTIFLMNLNSDREKDIAELMSLAQRVGLPKDLNEQSLNSKQIKNLKFLKMWIKLRLKQED